MGGVEPPSEGAIHVENDHEVRWRRKERDARLREMFDERKKSLCASCSHCECTCSSYEGVN